jgi:hypothetical protein
MSRADELLAQYQKKINKIGQWIAIRRYSGATVERTWVDTPAKAYIRYEPAKEFVGSVVQNFAVVYALAETLVGPPFDIKAISTNDKLMTAFTGFDDFSTAPPLNEEAHVTGGPKESAMFSIEKLGVSGKLIAFKIRAVG